MNMEALSFFLLLALCGSASPLPRRYVEYLVYQNPPLLEASPEVHGSAEYHNIYEDEVEDSAARKKAYQDSAGAVASKWAEENQIFTTAVPLRRYKAVNDLGETLHHREVPQQRPVYYKAHFGINTLRPTIDYEQDAPTIAEVHDDYSSHGQQEESPQLPGVPVLLPNGFLQDTPEVQAAKRKHFAALTKANVEDIRAKVDSMRRTSSYEY